MTLALTPALLPAAADAAAGGPAFARPSKALASLGAIAFCVLLAEGAIGDWSAIHLADTLSASEGTAVAGLAAFSATMAIGRLLGDRITQRLGNLAHLRGGALVAAAGIVVAATAPTVAVAVAGFALAGIGLSALFPLMVRAASERGGDAPGPGDRRRLDRRLRRPRDRAAARRVRRRGDEPAAGARRDPRRCCA